MSAAPPPPPAASAPSRSPSPNASKIVMGVDDALENLIVLKAVVQSAGYAFVGTKSGAECLSFVMRATPRLILLDIEMPDLNGFETCRRLRASDIGKHIPVAFLTARKSPEDVKRGIASGGNDFIVKPFDRVKLLDRIQHWTTRRV
jgi:two-component system OmpR family response regulator